MEHGGARRMPSGASAGAAGSTAPRSSGCAGPATRRSVRRWWPARAAPLSATRANGWPLNELGRIRLHRGDIAGAEEALLAAHRAGWDPQPVWRWCVWPRATRPRLPPYETRSSAPCRCLKERPPNTHLRAAAARGAGRDRDRDRRDRPGPIGRRRAGARRRPIPEQSVARQRRPRSRKEGAARRRRSGRRRTVPVGSGATLERVRRPL